jgi:hypothetical protein
MKTEEEGYLLAEIVAALFVLGILLSFLIPLFKELKNQEWDQITHLEALSLLQERMEWLSGRHALEISKGEETQKSRMKEQTYHIKWQTQFKRGRMMQMEVEIQWQNDNKKERILKATTYRYQN